MMKPRDKSFDNLLSVLGWVVGLLLLVVVGYVLFMYATGDWCDPARAGVGAQCP